MDSLIERPAGGRHADIGDLYDARSESLSSVNVLRRRPPCELLPTWDISSASVNYSYSEGFHRQVDTLSLGADITLSFCFGLFKTKGGAGINVTTTRTTKPISNQILYNVRTKLDYLRVSDASLGQYLNQDSLSSKTGTHVVVGIEWGADTTISFSQLTVEGTMALDKRGSGLYGKVADIMYNIFKGAFNSNVISNTVQIDIRADVTPPCMQPRNIQQLKTYASQIPETIAKMNSGKGKQITYHLMPVSNLARLHNLATSNITQVFINTEQLVAQNFLDFFTRLRHLQTQLDSSNDTFIQNAAYVQPELQQDVKRIADELENHYVETQNTLKTTLIKIRSNEARPEQLAQKLNSTKLDEAERYVESLQKHVRRIAFIRYLLEKNVAYVGKGNIDVEILKYTGKRVYMLMSSIDHDEQFQTNCLFVKLVNSNTDNTAFIFVNIDQNNNIKPKYPKIVICSYENKYLSYDVKKETDANNQLNLAINETRPKFVVKRPVNLTNLEIFCPNSLKSMCDGTKKQWLCNECRTTILYGPDTNLYCECGRSSVYFWSFKCPKHDDFVQFTEKASINILYSLKPTVVKVSLTAGEFAVQWITSLVYFVNFNDIESARANLFCVRPTEDDHESIVASDNESEKPAGTRYNVNLGTHMLRVETDPAQQSQIQIIHIKNPNDSNSIGENGAIICYEEIREHGFTMMTNQLLNVYDPEKTITQEDKTRWLTAVTESGKLINAILEMHRTK